MSEKMQQMAELDKMRKEFQWGLEVQKKADSGEDASGNCSIEQQQGDEDNKEEDREDREEDIDDGDSADNLRGQGNHHHCSYTRGLRKFSLCHNTRTFFSKNVMENLLSWKMIY